MKKTVKCDESFSLQWKFITLMIWSPLMMLTDHLSSAEADIESWACQYLCHPEPIGYMPTKSCQFFLKFSVRWNISSEPSSMRLINVLGPYSIIATGCRNPPLRAAPLYTCTVWSPVYLDVLVFILGEQTTEDLQKC